jgi:signal transduction histidine kinase
VWWVGDVMGDLIVAPILLVAWTRPPLRRTRNLAFEAAIAILAVTGTLALVFWNRESASELGVPPHLLFPVLLAVTVRFGQPGAAAANFLATALAILFTAAGYGPFVHSAGLSENLLQLQLLMGVVAVTTLVLGATVAERDRAVQAREEFLSVASHELRTPLTSLSLQLQLLARSFVNGAGPGRDRAANTVQTALRQTAKLGRLIRDLLDVSRIRADRLDLALEEFDLGKLAEEVAATYEGPFRAAGSSITIERAGDCTGLWDRRRMEQVIDNLLSNALKYGGGKPVDVAVRATSDVVFLSVRDQGIGIAAGDRRRIFDRWERATPARGYGGLGLGLWIAREIVEAHRGTISVDSEASAGSTFILQLPRSGPRQVKSPPRQSA